MKFTKGEWHQSDQWWDKVFDSDGRLIATADKTIRDIRGSLANAHLIAAAPKLDNALRLIIWDLTNLGKVSDLTVKLAEEALAQVETKNATIK